MGSSNHNNSEWETKPLGEIATFSQGKQVGLKDQLTEPKDGYVRFVRIVDYTQKTDDIRYVPNPGDRYHVTADDIVMVRYGSPGLIGRGLSGVIANNLFKINVIEPDVDNNFLSLFLSQKSIQDFLSTRGSATMPALNFSHLKNIYISYPGVKQQRRIVSILDEAFAGIDAAVANTEKNLANARELFESYLNGVFTRKGDGWVEKKLNDLGKITSSKRIYKSEYVESGVPFYRTKEVKELANGKEITTELFISNDRYEEIKLKFGVPLKGEILLTAIGTIGEIWVVDGNEDFYFKDGNVLWLKEFASVNPHFLRYVLISFVENLKRMSHGSAYNALPIEKLKKHVVYLPPIEEQEQIVERLDYLASEVRSLETIYQKKLAVLAELKQSILQQAFFGELTADAALGAKKAVA